MFMRSNGIRELLLPGESNSSNPKMQPRIASLNDLSALPHQTMSGGHASK